MAKKYLVKRMSPEELRRLQLIQVDMLIELDRICRKYNIKYIIDSGTLLGAARDGKFIPWDDDIDVSMLRSEYERFCKVCKDELKNSKYFLQNSETDSEYRWGYGKLIRLDTAFVRINQEHLKMKQCMYIDIFPVDGAPDNSILQHINELICVCLRKISWSEVGKLHANKALYRSFMYMLSILPKKLPNYGFNLLAKICKEQDHLKVKKLAYVDRCQGYDKKWYTDVKEIAFEGHMFYAPADTEGWLRACYGEDYMTPPPVEQRDISSPASSYKFPESV